MSNPFDKFDERGDNPFDRFDDAPRVAAAPKAKPFGQQLNDTIKDTPRQVGLTARYAAEGLGDVFDAFVGNPARALVGQPAKRTGAALADLVNLPQPRTATERVVGDASRMVAGGAGMLGAASKVAQGTTGAVQGIAKMMASNPAQQLTSAAAAGTAGGYTRETGGNDGAQFVASLAAGVAAPMAMSGLQRGAKAVANAVRPNPATNPQQIDIRIDRALQDSGLKMADLQANVRNSLRADVAKALKLGEDLSPDAVRRLADYRMLGATPNAASLTLDPVQVTRTKNLAKLGANSSDPKAQQLSRTEHTNNALLIDRINGLGANTSDDVLAGGQKVMDSLKARDARAQNVIGDLYQKARDSSGRSAALDHHTFTNKVADLLHRDNVESFLTPDIRNKLNSFAVAGTEKGVPLTVEIAEQFKTNIGRLQRNSTDGNVRHALGLVRQALDDTPLMGQQAGPLGGNQLVPRGGLGQLAQNMGQEAIDAFNKARRMNRSWMQIVEKTPALEAVRDGIEPDKFVQQFIVGSGGKSNAMDVAMLKNSIKADPQAMSAVREQITAHLKNQALSGKADELGATFSNTQYNKALKAIGERKLKLFFNQDEINQMKAIGRVASYEQVDPSGSAVNRSNTAGAMGGIFERIASSPLVGKLPFGKEIVGAPLQNITVGLGSKQVMDAPRWLVTPRQPVPQGLMMSPAMFMGGEDEEQEKLRRNGLLTPVP